MKVLVDTPVWSEFLRRSSRHEAIKTQLRALIDNGDAILLGPIRQEILSGVKDPAQFERLRSALEAFPDESILTADYEAAARFSNECRAKGIQGSNTDFLLCAVATRLKVPLFTLDQDFEGFASILPIQLFETN